MTAKGRSRKNLSSPKTSVSLTKNRRRLRRDFCEWRRSRARKRAARPHRRAARNRPRARPQAGLRSARANSRGHSPRRLGSSALHHEKTRHKCTVFFRGGTFGLKHEPNFNYKRKMRVAGREYLTNSLFSKNILY